MCSVIGMAMVAQGAGALAKGVAAKQHGDAVKAAADLSADASERAAGDAVEAGKLKDLQVAMHGSSVIAAQRVLQSGSGVDVNIGAPKATQEATAAVNEVDRRTVARNATLQAYGLRARAQGQRQAGAYAQAEGDNAMIGTFLGGAGTLVGEGGKLFNDSASSSGGGDGSISESELSALGAL